MTRKPARALAPCIITGLAALFVASMATAQPPAETHRGGVHPCSVRTIAGAWAYATDLIEFRDPDNGELLGRGSSNGTMNIDDEGTLTGVYDLSVFHIPAGPRTILRDVKWAAEVTVNPDCTGTLLYGPREDSLVLVDNGSEIWGMTLLDNALITWRAKRVRGPFPRR